jgi:hypothetical protein
LVGGRLRQYRRPGGLDGKILPGRGNSNSDANCNGDGNCYRYGNRYSDCDGHRHSYILAHGDATRNSSYANTARSAKPTTSPIAAVVASLCEAQAWDDCKHGRRVSQRRGYTGTLFDRSTRGSVATSA